MNKQFRIVNKGKGLMQIETKNLEDIVPLEKTLTYIDSEVAKRVLKEENKTLISNTELAKLNNLDNTKDIDKPISNLAVTAIASKLSRNGYTGTAKDLETLALASITKFMGVAKPTDVPAGTGLGYWEVITPGTYTNFGDVVLAINERGLIARDADGGFSISQTPLDLTPYAKTADITSIVKPLLPTTFSKNLFNPNKNQVDRFVSINMGNLGIAEGWLCSSYISVESNANYVLSGIKTVSGIGFYDENKVAVRYLNVNLGTVTTESNEKYIVFSLESEFEKGYQNIQFEKGLIPTEYEPYANKIIKSEIQGLDKIQIKTDSSYNITNNIDIKVGANLYDPSKSVLGLIIPDGSLLTTGDVAILYNSSDYIPVTGGAIHTLYGGTNGGVPNSVVATKVGYYNSSKVFIGALVDNVIGNFTPPLEAVYMRMSFLNSPSSRNEQYGVFLGVVTVFDKYYEYLEFKDYAETSYKSPNAIASIQDVLNLNGVIESDNKVNYNLDISGVLTITSPMGSIVADTKFNKGYTSSDVFNFVSLNMSGVSSVINDDVAPMHIFNTTLGGNHGNYATIATVSAHGLTNTSIGTEWLNGASVRFYILRIVDANKLLIMSDNYGTYKSPSFQSLAVGVLTKGGSTLNVTAVTDQQIYPGVQNLTKKVLVNSNNLIASGSGTCKNIDVVESYEIYNPSSMLTNVKARVGTSGDAVFIGNGAIKVENIYRFVRGNTCLVITNVKVLEDTIFTDIMFNQMSLLGGNTSKMYIPNSNPLNASVDLRKPTAIAWSNSIPSSMVAVGSQPDPLNPPNRIASYRGNLGSQLGFLKTRGVGKNLPLYTNNTFEIRYNSGKVYPHGVNSGQLGTTLTAGTMYNAVLARSYSDLSTTAIGNRISVFDFDFEGQTFVYIDYKGSMIDLVDLNYNLLNGKEIEIIESKNCVLLLDTYNLGINVKATYIEGETCFIVIKI